MAYQNDDRLKTIETEYWVGYIVQDQRYLGRMVVVLKRPCPALSKISIQEAVDFHLVTILLENATTRLLGATMFNWSCLMNNAYQEDNPQPQVHYHFRPRYKHPPTFEGVTFRDPNFGHHYVREGGPEVEVDLSLVITLAHRFRMYVARERMRLGV